MSFGSVRFFHVSFSYFLFRIFRIYINRSKILFKQPYAFYYKLTIDNFIAEVMFLWASTGKCIITMNLIESSKTI